MRDEKSSPYRIHSDAAKVCGRPQGKAHQGIDLWIEAVNNAPTGIRVFDPINERWLLAQTAFLKGRPAVSLEHVNRLITESKDNGSPLPEMAYCLRADSLDALGRHQEASDAGTLCRL